MWRQICIPLEGSVGQLTNSVFRREEYPDAEVGLMRLGNFQPPFVWLRWERTGPLPLRSVNAWLDELQELVFEPIFYAEAHTEESARFLRFCKFSPMALPLGESLYVRKL